MHTEVPSVRISDKALTLSLFQKESSRLMFTIQLVSACLELSQEAVGHGGLSVCCWTLGTELDHQLL